MLSFLMSDVFVISIVSLLADNKLSNGVFDV